MANLIDTLRYLRADHNQKLGNRETDKFNKTKKNIHAKKALYHFDKARDLILLATAPHDSKKGAKEWIKANRDEVETGRMKDYLENGTNKEFYED